MDGGVPFWLLVWYPKTLHKIPNPKIYFTRFDQSFSCFFFLQDPPPDVLIHQPCLTYRMIHGVFFNLIHCFYMLKETADKENNAI